MGLTATKLAGYLGVDKVTISRWENAKSPITKPHDLFLRVVYSSFKEISSKETKQLIEGDFMKVQAKQKKVRSYTIRPNQWFDAANACATA